MSRGDRFGSLLAFAIQPLSPAASKTTGLSFVKRMEVFGTDAGWAHWPRLADAAAVLGTVKARPGNADDKI
jgi:hypothetical protein